jgi:hypothetical protein
MTEDYTKPLTTWELMKATADPDEMKELKEVEKKDRHQTLQRLKSEQYRANGKGYFKPNGEKTTLQELYKQNKYVKERAREILGSDKAAQEFMYQKVIRNPKYDREDEE